MAPKAPSASRAPYAAAPNYHTGIVQANGTLGRAVTGPMIGGSADSASTNSGYLVTWSRSGQTTPSGASGLRTPSGK